MNAVSEIQVEVPLCAFETKSRGRTSGAIAGGLVSVLTVLAWLLLIHNRFFTPHEGWFSYYGQLMKQGELPYRDFYFFTQPVSLVISRILVEFGDKLIYFRYYGLCERVCITAGLYILLCRNFSTSAAVCGTVASSFFLLAYATDALFSYLYTCLFFFLLALICLQEAWRNGARRPLWLALCGINGALAFFTKQSNGLFAVIALALAIILVSESLHVALTSLAWFSAGLVGGTAPFLSWLIGNGLWHPYVNEIFTGAVASKGGLVLFFAFLARQVRLIPVVCFGIMTLSVYWLALTRHLRIVRVSVTDKMNSETITLTVVAVAVVLAIVSVHRVGDGLLFLMRYASTILVEVMLYTLIPAFAFVLTARAIGFFPVIRDNKMPVALLIASFFWTWSCGMSWSVEEQSTIPSLGLLLAFIYDRTQIGKGAATKRLVLAATVAIIFLSVWQKWSCAFNWEGWREGMSAGMAHSHAEQISDYALDPGEVAMYDVIFDDMARYTKQGDQVVTFPTIPLFNFVGGRFQPTFAPVEYWDVCPDDVARRDAQRVTASRPRMIISLEPSALTWEEHDAGWRAGRRSGQHDFQDAIDRLTSSGDYRLLESYSTPFYKNKLLVWAREK